MALAIIFDSIGVGEWLVLLAVVLVVVGPKRLPATARTIGKHYAKFRRAADSFKRQLMEMDTEINRVVEDAEREVESAVGMDDFAEEMSDDSVSGEPDSGEPDSGEPHNEEGGAEHEPSAPDAAPPVDDTAPFADDVAHSADESEDMRRGPYGD